MTLDIRSVFLVAAVTEILFAVMLASSWRDRRSPMPLIYWSLGSFFAGLASIGTSLRGEISDLLSLELSNLLAFAALGLRLAGMRSFAGQPVKLGWLLLPSLLLGVLFHFREPLALDLGRRVTITGTLGIGFGLLMLYDLTRAQREERLTMRRIVIAAIYLQTLNDVVRLLVSVLGGFEGNQFLAAKTGVVILLLNVFCLYGVLNLGCFMMLFERHENQLVRAATVDALTSLLNRKGFEQLADRQRQRSVRDGQLLSVLVMDLDWFKSINDRYGHEAGDAVLSAFAQTARAALRPTDLLSRPGGEEFWALLPDTDLEDARLVAQRVCDQFRGSNLHFAGWEISATVSLGVAQVLLPDESLQTALGRADQALYEAKHAGRNRVATATLPSAAGDH